MKGLIRCGDTLYVALGDRVVVVNLKSNVIENELLFDSGSSQEINGLSLNESHRYICASFSNKWCCSWNLDNGSVIGSILLKKRPTAIAGGHFKGNDVLMVSDKFGDIWALDAPFFAKAPVLCGGHTTSIVTDMVMLSNYLVTSDRDEKIRVTNFPSIVSIQSYCLGHESVVTSILPIRINTNSDLLVSCGWDYQVFLWEVNSGKALSKFSLSEYSTSGSSNSADAESEEESNHDEKKAKSDDQADDGDDEKCYDEKAAGCFPLKLFHFEMNNTCYVGVIFKNSSLVVVLEMGFDDNGNAIIQERWSLQCSSFPIDGIAISNNELAFLLASPGHFEVYDLNSRMLSSQASLSQCIDTLCRDKGLLLC